jgi:hypothetical protein
MGTLRKLGFWEFLNPVMKVADDVIPLGIRTYRNQEQRQDGKPIKPPRQQIKLAGTTDKMLKYLLGNSHLKKPKYMFFNPKNLPTPSYMQETSGARPVDMIMQL